MKGFGIYVKNDLLDPKHLEKMGASPLFLYLWLLDKMTSINENGIGKVLGTKPVTYELVKEELGYKKHSYYRHLTILEDEGYIKTLRTPYGLIITIQKAQKIFGKRVNKNVESELQKSRISVANLDTLSYKKVESNKDNTVDNTKDNTIDNVLDEPAVGEMPLMINDQLTSNALKPANVRKQPDAHVQAVIDQFQGVFGVKLKKMRTQRNMAFNLIKRYELERVLSAIQAAHACKDEQYAPMILNLEDLWEKWEKLEAFYRRTAKKNTSSVAIITEDPEEG